VPFLDEMKKNFSRYHPRGFHFYNDIEVNIRPLPQLISFKHGARFLTDNLINKLLGFENKNI